MKYYVDTCVYLNVIYDEKDRAGRKLGLLAERFFAKIPSEDILSSGVVLNELESLLPPERFSPLLAFFSQTTNVRVTRTDTERAMWLQYRHPEISYGDALHLSLAKRLSAVLITRDKALLLVANEEGCAAGPPEAFTPDSTL